MDKTWIVAELGINANANMDNMKALIWAAKQAGADYVKFQVYFGKWKKMRKYEFTKEQWCEIFDECDKRGIQWFASPFDVKAIDFLSGHWRKHQKKKQHMKIWKIPSGFVTHHDFLRNIDKRVGVQMVFLSTGMCAQLEIEDAYKILKRGPREVVVLQCTTTYPTPYDEVNLNVLNAWRRQGIWEYGLSDHTPGIETSIAAVALGARVIEKHFTLDKTMEGPDQKASLERDEFAQMVKAIRNIGLAMGSGEKRPAPSELLVVNEIRERML